LQDLQTNRFDITIQTRSKLVFIKNEGVNRLPSQPEDVELLAVSAGELDRAALGSLIFSNPTERKKLNKATHLPVYVEMCRQLVIHWLTCKAMVVRFFSIILPDMLPDCILLYLTLCQPSVQQRSLRRIFIFNVVHMTAPNCNLWLVGA